MKNADITTIFKKDDNMNKVNYKPISLLAIIVKIFERLIDRQLPEYIPHFFLTTIRGFRQGHNT